MMIAFCRWLSISFLFLTIEAFGTEKKWNTAPNKHIPTASHTLKNCITTSGNERFPWWQVEFPHIIEIQKISLQTNKKNHPLHDLRISAGIEDISQMNKDEVFEKNKIIKQIDGFYNRRTLNVSCERKCAGKFLTFQIVKPCNLSDCPSGNVLNLCDVIMEGYEEFNLDLTENRYWGDTEKEKWNYDHSSVAFGGAARLEKTGDGGKVPWYWRENDTICAYGDIKQVFTEAEEPIIDQKYVTVFPTKYLVIKVKFKTVDAKDFPSKEKFHMQIFIQGQKVNLCTEYKGFFKPQTEYEFDCQDPLEGSIGIIKFVDRKSTKSIFILCPNIQYWSHRVINVAKGRPTRQSSRAEGSVSSFVPVDGSDGWVLEHRSYTGTLRCSFTSDEDLLPWWRVDLLRPHFVTSVTISGSKKEYFHDLLISVGMNDISETEKNTVFTKNAICREFTGFELYSSTLAFKCSSRTLGRFVSIQITKQCSQSQQCKLNSTILNLCSVQVYGLPVDIYYYGNVAYETELVHIVDNLARNKEVSYMDFGWMFLDFKDTAVVQTVVLVPENWNSSEISVHFQVRVGFKQVNYMDAWHWEDVNDLCFEGELTMNENNFVEIECKENLLGSNVLVQYNCTWIENQTSCLDSPLFKFIEAWVLKIKPNLSAFKGIPEDPDETFSYGWRDNEMEQVVAKQFEPITKVKLAPICSQTIPGEDPYPWLQITFSKLVKVSGVIFNNTNDISHRRLHDIEIRVGIYNIMDAPSDRPFKANQLCFSSGSSSLSEGRQDVSCHKPVIGFYLTIQIVKNCSDSSQCDVLEPNILHVCFVDVLGETFIFDPKGKNLTDSDMTKQSSRSE